MLQKQFLIIFLDSKPSGQKVNDIVVRTRDLLAEVGGVLNIFNKTGLLLMLFGMNLLKKVLS